MTLEDPSTTVTQSTVEVMLELELVTSKNNKKEYKDSPRIVA